jgi:hypothetical protein
MYNEGKNIIQKQFLYMYFNVEADGLLLQQEVNFWCSDQLLPAIEKTLDKYTTEEHHLSIEKLNIDIALDFSTNWQSLLISKIIEQVDKKLGIIKSTASLTEDISLKTKESKFEEILSYFLINGFLPWFSVIGAKEDFNAQLYNWLQTASLDSICILLPLLQNDAVQQRFIYELTDPQFILFVARIKNIEEERINALLKDVQYLSNKMSLSATISNRLHYDFKKTILVKSSSSPAEELFTETIKTWLQRITIDYKLQFSSINVKEVSSPEFKKIIKSSKSLSQKPELHNESKKIQEDEHKSRQQENLISINEKQPSERKEDSQENEAKEEQKTGIASIDEKKSPDEKREDIVKRIRAQPGEGIYINNAGAIIIAPFMPALYSRTALASESRIKDVDTAILLLYYAITSNEYPPEFELVLPKILCGVYIEEVVNTNILLSEHQKKEADEMLASLVAYWSILKNTSIQGLREAFLKRNGKLTLKKDGWLLQVEQKPYDMLLKELPWSISMIKLSWMQQLITTEWM